VHKLLVATLAMLTSAMVGSPVMAGSVIEAIETTGVLVAGTSKDAFPFAFQDERGELVGYSIDMMRLIQEELAKELGRPVRLQLVALKPEERIPKIEAAAVNLVCDASSFTWERDESVDFSVSYAITGTQLLVPVGSTLSDPESLRGQRVGALARTTNEQAIRTQQPEAEIVLLQDRDSGYRALANGEIDAFADDGMLLYSWLARSSTPSPFKVAADSYSKRELPA
jgi:polar amino acid transport system substrate-binding protein